MGVLGIILLVFFIVAAILLVALVLVQNEEGDSLGGIFAGGSGSAFGSRSGNILTKATSLLGAIFLLISLGLALLNRTPVDAGVIEQGQNIFYESSGETFDVNANNWLDEEINMESLTADTESIDLDLPDMQLNETEIDSLTEENLETGIIE